MRLPAPALVIGTLATAAASCGGGDAATLGPRAGEPLAVYSISPSEGSALGGTLVTLRGRGFHQGASVTFDSVGATVVMAVSAEQIVAVAPAYRPGQAAVFVELPGFGRAKAPIPFQFVAATDTGSCAGCWDRRHVP